MSGCIDINVGKTIWSSRKENPNAKVSEMLATVAGDLLLQAGSLKDMQARLDMVKHAWNISLYSEKKRKSKLKSFIESQKPYAPSKEALMELEWEYMRIMKQKQKLYPSIRKRL